jgi:SNF2 family DNA or RNA helicase
MEIINNITKKLRDDLAATVQKGGRVSIAAACFSIYAYQELKKQLNSVESLRFLFTSPAFTTENAKKEKREFYIPRLNREKSLYGTEFEIKLRNKLTQKAIARECADWIKRKAVFKSNVTQENMAGFLTVENTNTQIAYSPINGFTTVDLGCERGNNIYNMVNKLEAPFSSEYIRLFNSIWNDSNRLQNVTQEVIDNITAVYRENSPEFIYFVALYHIFHEFLEDISEDTLPNEATGFQQSEIWKKLYNFQKDAACGIINKLEKYNGCILADSVGLGKTFTALAVIKYYENRNKSVLVLCPKKLAENWNTYKGNYLNNPVAKDRLRYDVLFHTDLSRDHGDSNGTNLDRLNWANYDLVVIDESHNFRNGGLTYGENGEKENRYLRLLNRVIRPGVRTKVLMLSATPVNNRFYDLRNQLALAYEGEASNIDGKLNTKRSIDDIFRMAQGAFTTWSRYPPEQRTTDSLLKMLDYDFFEVLDSVTIARSRKHIRTYYDTSEIGAFPERLKPISERPPLTLQKDAINYHQIYETLLQLNLSIYTPSKYIFESRIEKYERQYEDFRRSLTQQGREQGIRRLMSVNLLKRLESSVHSFRLTLARILTLIQTTIETVEDYVPGREIEAQEFAVAEDFDEDDQNTDLFTIGRKVKIELADMDYKTWLTDLMHDRDILTGLLAQIDKITPENDAKLQTLLDLIEGKIQNPVNPGNRKILIFSAFSDTVEYLFEYVSRAVKEKFGLETAMITGSVDGKTTIPGLRADLNHILTCFSPISKEKRLLMPNNNDRIEILIATDCISEGQNLQDCDYLVNYDIHWNPVRIIQRFGRIDRIGSHNQSIQLVNFWPDVSLDEYINLKSRVESRMKISVISATGDADDDPLSDDKGEMEYRKQQLERLQNEVVDLEDMSTGVSILDLGLNDFRMDLLSYMKENPDIEKAPCGLHAVVPAGKGTPPGVIFVLKNRNNGVNIDQQNRIHPFYMVYLSDGGQVVCDHLSPKKLLDTMRLLCRGKDEPIRGLCRKFNEQTKDGRDMRKYSELLQAAVASIIQVKEESDIDSFFSPGETSALKNSVSGLDDFELICFLVVLSAEGEE